MAKRKESGSSRALNSAPSSSTIDPDEPVYLRTKARLWHIFPLVALEVIGQSVLIPFFPKIFAEFFDENLRMVYWVAGGTVALNSFLTFTFAPSIGRLSDAYGRKPFLLLAVVSSHFQYFVLAFNGNLWFYFALAASTGVVAVSVALISSFVADVCPPQDRSKAFGQVVGALGVGGLLGIGLGGLLHYDIAKWIPVVLVVINSAYLIFCVPESLPLSHRAAPPGTNNPCATWGFLRKTPIVEQVSILTFLSTVALNGIQDTILFYLRNHRHFTPENIATFLIVGMGATVLIQWVGLPFLEKHMVPRSILILALSSASVSIGLYALAWKNWHFYLIIVLSALGYLTYTVGAAVIANQAGKTDQGVLQGAFSGLNKFGMGMGPLIFNSLAGATTDVFPDAPFLLGCAVAFSALLVAFNLPEDTSQFVFKPVTLSEEDLEEQTETES